MMGLLASAFLTPRTSDLEVSELFVRLVPAWSVRGLVGREKALGSQLPQHLGTGLSSSSFVDFRHRGSS